MDTEMQDTTANAAATVQNSTKFQHHTLRLVFPALDLLEEGLDAWTLPPDGVADREEPELSRFGLSPEDLDYFVRFHDFGDWEDNYEDWWGVEWDENPLRTPQQHFADRLLQRDVNAEGKYTYLALGDVDVLADEMQWVYAKLPCGHHTWFETEKIRDMSAREAWTAVCSTCDRRIFTEDDDKALKYYYDRLQRYDWMEAMRPWISNCRSVRNNSSLVQISAVVLVQSMADALETFKMPESINPGVLCPTNYPESWKLLDAFADTLLAHSEIPAMTPRALFKNLEQLAWVLIKAMVGDDTLLRPVLPPGFKSFVKRWLRRAVHDAVGVQADDEQDGEMMDMLSKMQRSKIDPKTVVESDFDDIVRQIGEASFGTTSGKDQSARDGDEEL